MNNEIVVGWDGLIQIFSRDELPIQKGLSIFLEQFSSKMSLEYNSETIDIKVVEFELARMFPKVEQHVVDSYLTKKKKQIEGRIQSSDIYEEENIKISLLQEEIEGREIEIWQKKDQKEELMFWEKLLGKEKDLEEEISDLQSEIDKLKKKIK